MKRVLFDGTAYACALLCEWCRKDVAKKGGALCGPCLVDQSHADSEGERLTRTDLEGELFLQTVMGEGE